MSVTGPGPREDRGASSSSSVRIGGPTTSSKRSGARPDASTNDRTSEIGSRYEKVRASGCPSGSLTRTRLAVGPVASGVAARSCLAASRRSRIACSCAASASAATREGGLRSTAPALDAHVGVTSEAPRNIDKNLRPKARAFTSRGSRVDDDDMAPRPRTAACRGRGAG